jgi:hypothetical protein
MFQLKKIISGGQTGVDRGALEAALELGIEVGGWCPPKREAEDGEIPTFLPLKETPEERSERAENVPRSLRTEWNVRDSDATLILMPSTQDDPGTEWAKTCCLNSGKLYLLYNPFNTNAAEITLSWLKEIKPEVLNVAGPSESNIPGIQETARKVLTETLLNLSDKKKLV